MSKNKKMLAAVCIVFFGFLATAGVIQLVKRSRTVICATQLVAIGGTIARYQIRDANGQSPPNLERFIETKELSYSLFICASSGNSSLASPYEYRGDDLNKNAHEDMIFLYEIFPNHRYDEGSGLFRKLRNAFLFDLGVPRVRNVLFASGHTLPLTEEQFEKAIQRDNALRKKLGFPQKPRK